MTAGSFVFHRCRSCYKKVEGDACAHCSTAIATKGSDTPALDGSPEDAYRLLVRFIDHTGSLDRLTLFGDVATQYLSIPVRARIS